MAKTPRTRTTAPPTNQSIVAASGQLNGRSDEAEKLSPRLEPVSARTRCRTPTQGRRSCSQGFRISSSSRRHEQPGARQSPFPVPAQRRTPRPNQQTRATTSHSPQARPLFSRALSRSIRKPPKPQGNRSQARPVSSFRKLPPTFSSFVQTPFERRVEGGVTGVSGRTRRRHDEQRCRHRREKSHECGRTTAHPASRVLSFAAFCSSQSPVRFCCSSAAAADRLAAGRPLTPKAPTRRTHLQDRRAILAV
jgi:hypothetical protein